MSAATDRTTRLGKVGRYLNLFWPVEPWISKANADLLVTVLDNKPEILMVVGACRTLAGTLAQIKTSLPSCQLVFVWPDSLLNCYSLTLSTIPVYDLIATYSSASIDAFKRLGARRAQWVPFGFDPELHPPGLGPPTDRRFIGDYDVCFVGNYGPEREMAILALLNGDLRVGVWGAPSSWAMAKDKAAASRYFKDGPLFDKDLAAAVRAAPLSLNRIRRVNFPAANMRFFEILGSGGVPLSSSCPEMESLFPHNEACIYFTDEGDVVAAARNALKDRDRLAAIGRAGQEQVLANHTYTHRARQIIETLSAF